MSYGKGSPMKSPMKTPCIGAVVFLLLMWTLWSLEIHSVKLVTDEDISVTTQRPDEIQKIVPIIDPEADVYPITEIGNVETHPHHPSSSSDALLLSDPSLLHHETTVSEKPLILYAYSDGKTRKEKKNARTNLNFFLAHGLHAAADFVFIFNGETDAVSLIPKEANIRSVQRPNDCYDMGAYAEVLTKDNLYKGYKKFIMLNASIRGPFLPYWAEACWSDMYLRRVTDEVKLVGMTANCWPTFHIQSMIWATDITGLEILLFPPKAAAAQLSTKPLVLPSPSFDKLIPAPFPGINSCFHSWGSAVAAEIGSSALIKAAGYKLDAMMSAYHANDKYEEECDSSENGDVLFDKKYFGTNVHPFETVFIKTNRDIDPVGVQRLSEWTRGRKYSSYDFCPL